MDLNDSKSDETDDDENVFSLSTQENEGFDVTWDWNSPRCKRDRNVTKKKRIRDTAQHSPKLSLKRHLSNNQIPVFDQIKKQMTELRNEIIGISSTSNNNHPVDTFFDDSVEQELVLCSEKVEAQMATFKKEDHVIHEDFADDSFDLVLEQLDEEEILQLTQPKKQEEPHQISEIKPVNNKLCGHQQPVVLSDSESSPMKCSPQEIEQKRLLALEKLESKKRQQIIEKNRQEALKRLAKNRKKTTLPRNLNVVIK